MFSLVKDLPVMFGIIFATWVAVAIIVLMHLLKRTDISKQNKIIWVIVGLIPIIGIGTYSVANFKKNKFRISPELELTSADWGAADSHGKATGALTNVSNFRTMVSCVYTF